MVQKVICLFTFDMTHHDYGIVVRKGLDLFVNIEATQTYTVDQKGS